MSEENEDVPLDEVPESHDDETPAFEEVDEQMDCQNTSNLLILSKKRFSGLKG